jgi:hypothetical protein
MSETPTLQTPADAEFDKKTDESLEMGNSARQPEQNILAEAAAAGARTVDLTPVTPRPERAPLSFGTKVGIGTAGVAIAAASFGVGTGMGGQEADTRNATETTIATTRVIPATSNGEVYAPVQEGAEQLLEQAGYAPDAVSAESIRTAVNEAVSNEMRYDGTIDPGDQFTINLNKSTGGFLTLGSEHIDIEVVQPTAPDKPNNE